MSDLQNRPLPTLRCEQSFSRQVHQRPLEFTHRGGTTVSSNTQFIPVGNTQILEVSDGKACGQSRNACRGKFTFLLVALVILWGHQPGFAETRDVEQLRQAAEQGDAETQFSLGQIYSFGRGVPWDGKEAARWYRLAAEQGHTRAQLILGDMYARGSGVPWDYQEAVNVVPPGSPAEAGDAGAHFKLGVMYEYGEGVPENEREAEKWYREAVRRYRKAAEQGDAEAQYMLGSFYRTGKLVAQNHNEAMKWLRMAAEQGTALAQFNLSLMYADGLGVPPDHNEAMKWLRMAAEQGFAAAQVRLAQLYAKGQGTLEDHVKAYAWLNLGTAHCGRTGREADRLKDTLRKQMTAGQVAEAEKLAAELRERIEASKSQ